MSQTIARPFLALWNDIDASVRTAYDIWHTFEHVKERVSLPGFIAARRYVSGAAARPRYFTLYDIEQTTDLESPAYRDVVAHPTAWSQAMRPHFSGVSRLVCTTLAEIGEGSAGALATVCITTADDIENTRWQDQLSALHPRLETEGVTSVRVGRVEPTAGGYAALKLATQATEVTYVLLVEGLWPERVEAAARTIAHGMNAEAEIETFRFAYRFTREDQGAASGRRQPQELTTP